ncbi:MAG: antibiotic biosynthesis monooxygenase [Actinomycetota bacterium]
MIIIAGSIDYATREDRDKAVELATPIQKATQDDEPGCEAYVFAADPCIETRLGVYELWIDEASLAAHFEHENYVAMGAALRGLGIVATDTRKFRCDLAEPVYDDTRTPRADFFTA